MRTIRKNVELIVATMILLVVSLITLLIGMKLVAATTVTVAVLLVVTVVAVKYRLIMLGMVTYGILIVLLATVVANGTIIKVLKNGTLDVSVASIEATDISADSISAFSAEIEEAVFGFGRFSRLESTTAAFEKMYAGMKNDGTYSVYVGPEGVVADRVETNELIFDSASGNELSVDSFKAEVEIKDTTVETLKVETVEKKQVEFEHQPSVDVQPAPQPEKEEEGVDPIPQPEKEEEVAPSLLLEVAEEQQPKEEEVLTEAVPQEDGEQVVPQNAPCEQVVVEELPPTIVVEPSVEVAQATTTEVETTIVEVQQ